MWSKRYFSIRYWTGRFWPPSGVGAPTPPVEVEGIADVRSLSARRRSIDLDPRTCAIALSARNRTAALEPRPRHVPLPSRPRVIALER